jgi:hypothetical protein
VSLASSCLSLRPYGKTRLPLNGFSWNFVFGHFSKICSIPSPHIFQTHFLYPCVEEGSVAYLFLNREKIAHVFGGRGEIHVLILNNCFLLTQNLWHDSTNLYTDFRISKWSFLFTLIICLWNQLNFYFKYLVFLAKDIIRILDVCRSESSLCTTYSNIKKTLNFSVFDMDELFILSLLLVSII